jgi:hypothetical protein
MARRTMAALAIFLCLTAAGVAAADDRYRDDSGGQYVFAVTRGLNEGTMHPAFKVTLLPLAVIADLVFLPFALVADTMT